MNKVSKIAILGSALAIVGTLGYTAFAANTNDANGNGRQNMLDNAVQNGVIDETTKNNLEAFNHEQMQNEMNDMIKTKLSNSVTDGTITQEESDTIQSWYDAKPEAVSKLKGLGFGEMGRFGSKGHGMGNPNDNTVNTETQ